MVSVKILNIYMLDPILELALKKIDKSLFFMELTFY